MSRSQNERLFNEYVHQTLRSLWERYIEMAPGFRRGVLDDVRRFALSFPNLIRNYQISAPPPQIFHNVRAALVPLWGRNFLSNPIPSQVLFHNQLMSNLEVCLNPPVLVTRTYERLQSQQELFEAEVRDRLGKIYRRYLVTEPTDLDQEEMAAGGPRTPLTIEEELKVFAYELPDLVMQYRRKTTWKEMKQLFLRIFRDEIREGAARSERNDTFYTDFLLSLDSYTEQEWAIRIGVDPPPTIYANYRSALAAEIAYYSNNMEPSYGRPAMWNAVTTELRIIYADYMWKILNSPSERHQAIKKEANGKFPTFLQNLYGHLQSFNCKIPFSILLRNVMYTLHHYVAVPFMEQNERSLQQHNITQFRAFKKLLKQSMESFPTKDKFIDLYERLKQQRKSSQT